MAQLDVYRNPLSVEVCTRIERSRRLFDQLPRMPAGHRERRCARLLVVTAPEAFRRGALLSSAIDKPANPDRNSRTSRRRPRAFFERLRVDIAIIGDRELGLLDYTLQSPGIS